MLFNLYVFFIHLITWVFLYFLPILFVTVMVLIVTLFLKNVFFTEKGNNIRHRKELTYQEKREAIESFSLRISFLFKAFFYGIIITTVVLTICLWLYEF